MDIKLKKTANAGDIASVHEQIVLAHQALHAIVFPGEGMTSATSIPTQRALVNLMAKLRNAGMSLEQPFQQAVGGGCEVPLSRMDRADEWQKFVS